ncbi:proprotein convertase P-domain-containing protein [Marilutibacter aestuarii]|uniref:proprotein convertase P-domain-containing protein n=1 Tax=Marilutibacter aestuarii TaxID=1706195 RepID=UPI001B88156E|nr:proprotein convertase P-domain-containing protein [Lysobacter aestuarii]
MISRLTYSSECPPACRQALPHAHRQGVGGACAIGGRQRANALPRRPARRPGPPDGSVYLLANRSGGATDNIIGSATVDLSSETLNGTWKLRVNDNAGGEVGYINEWSLTF